MLAMRLLRSPLDFSEAHRRMTRSVHRQIEDVEPVIAGDDVVETLRLQAPREIQLGIGDAFIELLLTHERSGRVEKVASSHRGLLEHSGGGLIVSGDVLAGGLVEATRHDDSEALGLKAVCRRTDAIGGAICRSCRRRPGGA